MERGAITAETREGTHIPASRRFLVEGGGIIEGREGAKESEEEEEEEGWGLQTVTSLPQFFNSSLRSQSAVDLQEGCQ